MQRSRVDAVLIVAADPASGEVWFALPKSADKSPFSPVSKTMLTCFLEIPSALPFATLTSFAEAWSHGAADHPLVNSGSRPLVLQIRPPHAKP